jgi:uncharacterized protein YutE (UPF0331/DUF86 family)
VTDPVLLNKVASIEACLARVEDPTVFDAIVLNLQRACESSIDLAMHLCARKRLGVPQTSREAFTLLEKAGAIDARLADQMRKMVGFRNIAIHDYMRLDRAIVAAVIERGLAEFEAFCRAAVRAGTS